MLVNDCGYERSPIYDSL